MSQRTDVSQEDQERQQDHDKVAVPDDETAVELNQTKKKSQAQSSATDMNEQMSYGARELLTMKASKRIVVMR